MNRSQRLRVAVRTATVRRPGHNFFPSKGIVMENTRAQFHGFPEGIGRGRTVAALRLPVWDNWENPVSPGEGTGAAW
jgi:hypothetical protein